MSGSNVCSLYLDEKKGPGTCVNRPGVWSDLIERPNMAKGTCSVESCERTDLVLQWCSKHYQRVKKYGTAELPKRPSLEEKFWPKVDRTGECWIWTGAVDARGVLLFWDSNTGKQCHANRIAYELTRGHAIPERQRARRSCGNNLCIHPDHLVASPAERFWADVDKTDTCWNWTGSQTEHGYGHFTERGKYVASHRWSYKNFVGPIPRGACVDHICRNPSCVRPDHLRLVTNKQNLEHQRATGRQAAPQYRGVFPQGGKWRAMVRHNGKLHHIGYFEVEEDAAEAARLKRNELYTHNDLDRDVA